MEIKYEKGVSCTDIVKTLTNNEELNRYIDENVKKSSEWVIYANLNYFIGEKISQYRDIEVIYNDFVVADTLIVIYHKKNNF